MSVRRIFCSIVAACALLAVQAERGQLQARTPEADASASSGGAVVIDEKLGETIDKVTLSLRLLDGRVAQGDMVVTHFKPPGAGPFPAIVINHGRTSAKRHDPPRVRMLPLVRFWVRRGFAVVVPTRVGYGGLGQQIDPEAMGRCANANYRAAVELMATQVVAASRYAGRLGHVDGSRVLALGVSYGGFGVIAATARTNPGFIAGINFVGGMGGSYKRRPGEPCRGESITEIAGKLGARARVPTLWLYSENDVLWGRDWPRRWYDAYRLAGGNAEFVAFPPIGDNGHRLMSKGFRHWRPVVDRFVRKLGFKAPRADSNLQGSGYARLDDVDRVPHLSDEARTRGYERFLSVDVPRAFAVSPSGAWAWRRGTDAASAALRSCQQRARLPCRLYAVDDRVVWRTGPDDGGRAATR